MSYEIYLVINQNNEFFSGFNLGGVPIFNKNPIFGITAMFRYCNHKPWGLAETEILIKNESLQDTCKSIKLTLT